MSQRDDEEVEGYSIPVSWGGPDGRPLPQRTRSELQESEPGSVKEASAAEIARYAMPQTTCGECKFGDFSDAAQRKIKAERFYERLVREEGWQLKHLCSSPKDLGLCGMSNGETMTGRLHRGCDQFKPRNGLVKISPKAT